MIYDSLIFDIDGTLWDATETVAAAFSSVSQEFGFGHREFTADRIRAEVGRPLDVIFRHLYPELDEMLESADVLTSETAGSETPSQLLARINEVSTKAEYEYLAERGGRLYDGVKETLEVLSAKMPLYIVSNCEQGYIELMTKVSGIDKYFQDWLCFGDTRAEKDVTMRILMEKHGLKKTAYIGDIDKDALSSRRAGVPFIWASYGFGEVAADMYDFRIGSFAELKNICA